jgi:hypothetical protein
MYYKILSADNQDEARVVNPGITLFFNFFHFFLRVFRGRIVLSVNQLILVDTTAKN